MKGGSIMIGFEMENFFDVNVATTFVENVLALLEIEGIYTQQALALMKHLKTNKNDEHAKRVLSCVSIVLLLNKFSSLLISRSSRKWFTTVSYVNGFKGFPALWYKQWELSGFVCDFYEQRVKKIYRLVLSTTKMWLVMVLKAVNNKKEIIVGNKSFKHLICHYVYGLPGDTNYSVSLKYIEVSDCACRLDWYLLDVVKWAVVQVGYVCILDEVMNHIILDEVGESDAERGECFLELERDCPELAAYGAGLESSRSICGDRGQKYVGIVIPNALDRYIVIGFGVCPDTSDPKLVKISVIVTPSMWVVEVFTLSARVWKTVYMGAPFKSCEMVWNQVFVDGVIYWRVFDDIDLDVGLRSNYIISFDLKTEKFGEVSLPEKLVRTYRLVVEKVNESLGLLEYYDEGEMSVCGVWTRKDGRMVKLYWKWWTIMMKSFKLKFMKPHRDISMVLRLKEIIFHSPQGRTWKHYFCLMNQILLFIDNDDGTILQGVEIKL
ncbi:F-box domain containing protein [Tanacetum coccineum]|uniref:F-box domain containing protein n=1 Tax=Tanacetum coccineum TaxID=301880 RepID=A0ABQ4X2C9_9ASTR